MASSSSSLELNLSLKPSYVPKTIANLLKDLSHVPNASDKLAVLNDYINQHEEELKSILAFRSQLPQCMLLLMEALGTLKDEYMNIKNGMESGNGRPLTEKYDCKGKGLMSSSPQLWNSNHENKKQKTFIDFIQAPNQNPIPFKENTFGLSVADQKGCISREIMRGPCSRFASAGKKNGPCGLNLRADNRTLNYQPTPLTQSIWKNNRRSWSEELHARFVEALNLLGGIEVATPKQIREVMQVEGLTNDQVKSHLQKYRLHCQRLVENNADCLVNFQDTWHRQIYYVDPLSPQNSDENDSNPDGLLSRKS